MANPQRSPQRERAFPSWGVVVLPGCALWGTLIGVLAGWYFGNVAIGAAIGAGIGVGLGFALFAAAVVIASRKF